MRRKTKWKNRKIENRNKGIFMGTTKIISFVIKKFNMKMKYLYFSFGSLKRGYGENNFLIF